MSSLFDVPQQLVMILSLASAGAGEPSALSISRGSSSDAPPGHTVKFSEQHWLEAVRAGAGGDELKPLAGRVFRTSGGRYYVPVEAERRAILKLREDGAMTSRLAFGLALINARTLEARLDRSPTASELYLAHTLGCDRTIGLIRLAERAPDEGVAGTMPELVADFPELKGPAISILARLGGSFNRRPTGDDVSRWFQRGSNRFAESEHTDVALVEQLAASASEVRTSLHLTTVPVEASWPSAWRVEVVASP